jgi:hypothetical protein
MEDNDKLKQEEKLKRISEEIKRLNKLFAGVDLKTRKAVHSLIENAAFMSVSLEDLQEDINANGYTEEYQNGANQSGVKKSSAVEVYNVMIKNHMGVMKQLTDLLPKPEGGKGKGEGDGFDDFMKKKNKM